VHSKSKVKTRKFKMGHPKHTRKNKNLSNSSMKTSIISFKNNIKNLIATEVDEKFNRASKKENPKMVLTQFNEMFNPLKTSGYISMTTKAG